MNELEPETALEMYIQDRQDEISDMTAKTHRSRASQFVEWCKDEGIEYLNEISPRDVYRYRQYRRADDPAVPTLKGHMDTLRVFLRWCRESLEAVDEAVPEAVQSPSVDPVESSRSRKIDPEEAADILDYLDRFEYASVEHAVMRLAWTTGMRIGALHALDLGDVDPDDRMVNVVNRPESDTRIKKGGRGERVVTIDRQTAEVIEDYIEHHRPDVSDDHGRDPLFASRHGRRHTTNLREIIYGYTRPCVRGEPCPDDRDPDVCDAAQSRADASKCPASMNPHAIRRGAITHTLISIHRNTPNRRRHRE